MTDDPRDAPTPRPRLRHQVVETLRHAQDEAEIHRMPTDRAPPPSEPPENERIPELAPLPSSVPPLRHSTEEPVDVVSALERLTLESEGRFADLLKNHEKTEQTQLDAKLETLFGRIAAKFREEAEKLAGPFLRSFEEWRKGESERIRKLEERVGVLEKQLEERVQTLKNELASVRRELVEARAERTLHEGGEDVG